ncbi:FAD:protein FMN transferase [Primorskyibacter aestuariivivens]|uniref:FAD:protein FMN transferase n=1 Tax=Primorskyibacter aestuariivivens TaxID=1888912 RepID=UPI002300C0EB|nr:FAD:protein FMN transferase [Primorskyibacter aestuariivivens]MDA7428479.1 FAD:protein FMN transferase [Primorskyibacter aestuariivivens]
MTLSRRRFLAISAAMAATPALARPHTWSGFALGAEVSVSLQTPEDPAPLIAAIRRELASIEAAFSLYDPDSEITRLNTTGYLELSPAWQSLLPAIDRLHSITESLFDPTVQPLWEALAKGHDPAPARALIGWHRTRQDGARLVLDKGQKLTLNGIAQGYATDRIRALLANAGLTQSLINIGEFAALGGPYRLGLSDPGHGHLGHVTLENAAVATSSPAATPLGPGGHILHVSARPRWSTVSVVADSATLADGLSTALTLAPLEQARDLARMPGIHSVRLVSAEGDLTTL